MTETPLRQLLHQTVRSPARIAEKRSPGVASPGAQPCWGGVDQKINRASATSAPSMGCREQASLRLPRLGHASVDRGCAEACARTAARRIRKPFGALRCEPRHAIPPQRPRTPPTGRRRRGTRRRMTKGVTRRRIPRPASDPIPAECKSTNRDPTLLGHGPRGSRGAYLIGQVGRGPPPTKSPNVTE